MRARLRLRPASSPRSSSRARKGRCAASGPGRKPWRPKPGDRRPASSALERSSSPSSMPSLSRGLHSAPMRCPVQYLVRSDRSWAAGRSPCPGTVRWLMVECPAGRFPSIPSRRSNDSGNHTMRIRSLGLTFVAFIALDGAAIAQDVAAGEKVFAKCKVCHQVGEGAKNGVGPVLNGIVGRKAGSIEGYNYTPANKNSGLTWDEATMKEYLKNPRAKIPGTKMIFPGLQNDADIDNVIAYLKQFGS